MEHRTTAAADDKETKPFVLSWRRIGIFLVFGTVISGPAFHYWFNKLNELPLHLWKLKNVRHRGKILQSYGYLRAHGIEVKLDLTKLPKAKELGKWTTKFSKIAADQLLFSSLYDVVLFMSLGILGGAVDKYFLGSDSNSDKELLGKYKTDSERLFCDVSALREDLHRKIVDNKKLNPQDLEEELRLLAVLEKLPTPGPDSCKKILWTDVWRQSWEKTKSVFWGVYIADCTVWPFLQLINFTFVPLRFQVLYVNVCNLMWNAFISFVENRKNTIQDIKEYISKIF